MKDHTGLLGAVWCRLAIELSPVAEKDNAIVKQILALFLCQSFQPLKRQDPVLLRLVVRVLQVQIKALIIDGKCFDCPSTTFGASGFATEAANAASASEGMVSPFTT